jgi:hypothetical protein
LGELVSTTRNTYANAGSVAQFDFHLNPYPRPSTASVFVKIVLPSKCDRGVSKVLSAELGRGSSKNLVSKR